MNAQNFINHTLFNFDPAKPVFLNQDRGFFYRRAHKLGRIVNGYAKKRPRGVGRLDYGITRLSIYATAFCPNFENTVFPKSLNFERIFTPYQVSHFIYKMSRIMCHMSLVSCHMSRVSVGGGSGINGAYPI